MAHEQRESADADGAPRGKGGMHWRLPPFRRVLLIALLALAVLWLAPTLASVVGNIDLSSLPRPYLTVFGFVVFDAVFMVLPSESLLTAGSNLAAQTGSTLSVWRLAVAGSLGAIVGDSILYWLARTVLRNFMEDKVERLQQNEKTARALAVMNRSAPILIVFGRFVPGLRFILGATMGLTRYPYPRFLLWDSIGGTLWAFYTCLFSYLVASVIQDRPIISIAVSVVVTTGLLALMYRPIKNSWEASEIEPASSG